MTMLRQLRRRLQMKSKIALFFMILISFLLQCTLLHVISIGSITPNLIRFSMQTELTEKAVIPLRDC